MIHSSFSAAHVKALFRLFEEFQEPEHLQNLRQIEIELAEEGLDMLRAAFPFVECEWPVCECVLDLANCKANKEQS